VGPEGLAAIDLATLVRTALRLRPDRLVVGEVRGDEALDLLQALNTGHDGSLATLHANGAEDALARLASLVVRAAPGWPIDDVHAQVGRSIDVVVHVARASDGTRRIVEVAEVDRGGVRVHLLADAAGVHRPLVRRRS
jgi:pilus assembly protein CpaF